MGEIMELSRIIQNYYMIVLNLSSFILSSIGNNLLYDYSGNSLEIET